MLITCITVTQASRLSLLAQSIQDFMRQTYPEREQLILHDGDAEAHDRILELLRCLKVDRVAAPVRVHRSSAPGALGQLRNEAVALSRGEVVCQWDDDDRYHPLRLQLQCQALREQGAAFCFLGDQLHWFRDEGALTWDDWDAEPYPLNFVQGTLTGLRALMPAYPPSARGEDTAVCLSILAAGHRIARLRGVGWCYVYSYHGHNVWSRQHHQAISRAKQLSEFRLRARADELRQRLAEYGSGLEDLTVWHRTGTLALA
jgi:glycosyltransferase involved in cell wall biosynthesis